MNARFNIVARRRWFFLLSGVITVLGLAAFLLFGFNLGADFRAGSRVQMQLNEPVDVQKVRDMFQQIGLSVPEGGITVAGTRSDMAVVRFPEVLTQDQIAKINQAEKQTFPKASGADVRTVNPIVAQQTSRKAVWSVLLASLFIVAYVSIRFEYRFAISGIVALLHDAFIVMSVFALLRLEVDLTFVAAILTIVGYSINDTIVIFDRIRENLRIAKPRSFSDLEHLVDKSLWQTMSRSINTVVTVLIAAVTLYFFGGQTIHNFNLALIVGLVSGAYSSIFIASPLWVAWRGRQMRRSAPEKHPA
ncbi:protein translocase subunit SecF [Alicyclobacillus macrosporangiidus]|uniref:Protein-export membrane protein SecF n=1 Tax=Alicyclobacillus macrosporangiidus TaxID=392015 RepID=A0A1I7J006_9BACL|nr:protein translocase subunit SecF [Alicyclobacillus macrosporangiidus]SFU78510.1 SecD/SecF fusion protein [Alicyclobacillus macrosporangiidus]